ncbi:SpoIIE family protein phosphatase [Lentzea sp. NBRC 102530]|uniref:SpoIIE family protein phosphatase n=1 Tax=Lentzea sp. NBRC 102530 TaxID=3032201 RepID=UPI0024A105F3|nr:SpoIIE family protein phosphatase [Lentzea sp. NBRC 102530]GLY47847.1 hypothetical protein Lesp01_15030 [Lentzea sp. NBRC 102530]
MIGAVRRELLPAELPVLPRVQFAASHLLSHAGTTAGADWFDALRLPDGRVAMIVGDVVDHGAAASATAARLRIVLHERLAATADVTAALAAVNAAASRPRGAGPATLCAVVFDPESGEVEYCTAGHPPPLVLSPNGEHRYLAGTGTGPLGVGGDFTTGVTGADRLAEGEIVLLYSGGVLERPVLDLGQASAALATAAGGTTASRASRDDSRHPVERVCARTLEALTSDTGHAGHVTVLAGQRVARPADLNLCLAAHHEVLPEVLDGLARWLAGARAHERDAESLRYAVGELAANAIEHAYLDSAGPDTFTVTATLTDAGDARVQVSDRGRWRAPAPSGDRGLGLQVAQRMVDTLRVDHDEHGTTATVHRRLGSSAHLLTASHVTWTGHGGEPDVLETAVRTSPAGPRLVVGGPVHAGTIAEFVAAVRTAGATGTRSLLLDLSGVTQLAGAGVSALYRLAASHAGSHTSLRVYCPAGSRADVVLTLVRLDHDTVDPDATG